MKKFLLCVMFCLTTASFAANPVVVAAHKATHKVTIQTLDDGPEGTCSGTAIGPHALLTATHCSSASAVITIDGKDADVMSTMGDGLDHTIVLLSGIEFKDYADVSIGVKQEQSDDVFLFGNPNAVQDIYRKGYVAGFKQPLDAPTSGLEALQRPVLKSGNSNVQVTFYDFNGFFGDSGSAIFNSEGKVVAVTSFITGAASPGYNFKLMGSYEMRFTAEQLKMAKEYNPPARPAQETHTEKKSFLDFFKF